MTYLGFPLIFTLGALTASSALAQTNVSAAGMPSFRPSVSGFHMNVAGPSRAYSAIPTVTGLPTGPNTLPYQVNSTPANDAIIRNNAWSAYNASLRQIPTAPNPNRIAAPQQLVDPNHFVQKPTSSDRYNVQFSDNEVRSVQAALRRMGIYAGQVDGILGPDTQRAIEDYQVRTKRPVTGQPDQSLNASLGIF
jgi:hypothetical protein